MWHTNHLEVMNELITEYPDAGLYATFTRTELVNGGIIEECKLNLEDRRLFVILSCEKYIVRDTQNNIIKFKLC